MRIAGHLVLVFLCLVTMLAFLGLVGFNTGGYDWSLLEDSWFHGILGFSLKQAFLSSVFSVALAFPVARAVVFRQGLPLRPAFLSLCLLAFVMPTMVLITGMVVLFGRSGLLAPFLGAKWNLYGLSGILLAHIYLNMPLAIRVLVQSYNHIPDSSWRLLRQWKLSRWQQLRLVEWPVLRPAILSLSGFIAVLCFNSFAVVLALGGGPQSSTLEVAIYQALKFEFNLSEALILAWTQLLLVGAFFLLLYRYSKLQWLSADTAARDHRPVYRGWRRTVASAWYVLAALFLLSPILALLPGLFEFPWHRFAWSGVFWPTLFSLSLGLSISLAVVAVVYLLLQSVRLVRQLGYSRLQWILEWLATHTLLAPAMVLSVGLYVLFLPMFDLEYYGWIFLIILNVALFVPFAYQQMRPRLLQYDAQYLQLVRSLRMSHRQRFKIEWPFIRPVCRTALALVMVLALGDVAVFSIFGPNDWPTLPWLIYRYASTYRLAEASLASFILLLLSFMVVFYLERKNADS